MRHSVKNEPVSTDKQYINYILFKTICKVFFCSLRQFSAFAMEFYRKGKNYQCGRMLFI